MVLIKICNLKFIYKWDKILEIKAKEVKEDSKVNLRVVSEAELVPVVDQETKVVLKEVKR